MTPRKRSQPWKKKKSACRKEIMSWKKRVQKLKREVDKLEDDKHQFEIAAYQRADSDSQKLETRKMEHNEFTESERKTMNDPATRRSRCRCLQVQAGGSNSWKTALWANFEWCWSSLHADSPQHGWWGPLYVKAADSKNCAGERRRNTAHRWHH